MPATVYLSGYPDMPRLAVDDSGTIQLQFVVTGATKDTASGEISYTLECVMEKIDADEQNLNSIARKAVEGAYSDTPMVKTQYTPAGS